jgi:hypothetical protein
LWRFKFGDDGGHRRRQFCSELLGLRLIDIDTSRLLSIAMTEGNPKGVAWVARFPDQPKST